ncbi:MAG: T9SS type A sorting domain-containing protein, partial [Ignavibacteriaceae bacterium]|nr:T9SS type A sorting domain-containing protein [Ignavibacteriaceae bacterium]
GVSFTDINSGTAVGYFGTILRTTEGGDNWVSQTSGTTNPLIGVSFTDVNNGTAVGGIGTILKTTTGGATYIQETDNRDIPANYYLSNNYPNPFNPSTKIKYSIPQSSNVVIKVFDVLGNEIETLVNEEKPAGTYELTWYAEGLPSGVYFYRIQAGSFVETKKMVLIN